MNYQREMGAKRNAIISDHLRASPCIPSRTLAKVLHETRPDLFASVELARAAIRQRTGAQGALHRQEMSASHGDEFRELFTGTMLPVPTPFWDSSPFVFDTERALIICDVHIPFHVKDAVEMAVAYAKKRGAKDVLIDGDLLDHYQMSDFCRVPDVGTLSQELADCKQFLQWLRSKFPKGRIIWKEGNHEERFAVKIHRAIPEVGNLMDNLTYEKIGTFDLGVEIVQDRRRIDMGYLTVIHGHELGRGTSNLVNAARTLQLRAKDCAATAHWHQPAQHRVRTIRGKHVGCWGIGCMCHLSPHYRPINDWELGFCVYERTDAEGGFVMDNRTIIGKQVV